MAYKFELPQETVHKLWQAREFCGGGSIISQIRESVNQGIKQFEEKIGTTVEDAAEAISRYERMRDRN